jgi:hypothetical protein
VSPIPQIAPTTADPGATLAGGLIGIGSQLADQEMRRRAKEKSETFAQYNQAIGEATTILNDDGSLNTEASIEASEAFAVNPESSIAGVLGDENASSLLADKDFSLTKFRLEMSRRKDKLLSSQALSYNEEILTLSQDPDLGLYGRDVIEDAMRRQSEAIARIDDSEYKANALNNAVTKQRAFNSIEQSAMSGGMQTAIEFFADVFEGEYDFLNPNKLDLLEDAQGYIAKQTAALAITANGTSSQAVSGFSSFDFETGKATATVESETLFKSLDDLPAEMQSLKNQISQLVEADKSSKDTASYIFSNTPKSTDHVIGTISENDLSIAIQQQFLPEVMSLTGIEQQDYIQKTMLKAQQSTGTIPLQLKETVLELVHRPATALNASQALLGNTFIINDSQEAIRLKTMLTADERTEVQRIRIHIDQHFGNAEAGLQSYLKTKERKGVQDNLAVTPYTDADFKQLNSSLSDYGFDNMRMSTETLNAVQALASLKYTELMATDSMMKPEDATKLATDYAINNFATGGIVPLFNNLVGGPSQEFYKNAGASGYTAVERGDFMEGAIVRALNEINYAATVDNLEDFKFVMSEEFVPEKTGTDGVSLLSRKIRVQVQTPDGKFIGIDENNKHQTDPKGKSKNLMFYIDASDFQTYRIKEDSVFKQTDTEKQSILYNSYATARKQGINESETVKHVINTAITVLSNSSFIRTNEDGTPVMGKAINYNYKTGEYDLRPVTYNVGMRFDLYSGQESLLLQKAREYLGSSTTVEEVFSAFDKIIKDPRRALDLPYNPANNLGILNE